MKSSMNDNNSIRIVVVGDGAVGKTCIVQSFKFDKFDVNYQPTIIADNYTIDFQTNEKNYKLTVWDTAGQEGFEKTRQTLYHGTDVFLIVFSVVKQQTDEDSFNNALNKWLPELQSEEKSDFQPIYILVGNKIDIREKDNQNHLQRDAILRTLKQNKIQLDYLECSAVTQKGLKEIFIRAVELKSDQQKKQQQKVEIKNKPNEVNQNYCCLIS